ncbi:hypothetical protein KIL84_013848 [Mauremys mutica]|uniref:Uncharacterized protein n=1 Tax=Mauremys mutica TaxID=74926 RepID=A0A9D4ASI0_9SAUR|nr:hypothetical protein KIL84_013848 [Mauremys mutica]
MQFELFPHILPLSGDATPPKLLYKATPSNVASDASGQPPNEGQTEEQSERTSLISEVHLLARTALQASLDSADTVARTIANAIVMHRASWLHLSGFPKEVQAMVEDLTFKGPKLLQQD